VHQVGHCLKFRQNLHLSSSERANKDLGSSEMKVTFHTVSQGLTPDDVRFQVRSNVRYRALNQMLYVSYNCKHQRENVRKHLTIYFQIIEDLLNVKGNVEWNIYLEVRPKILLFGVYPVIKR